MTAEPHINCSRPKCAGRHVYASVEEWQFRQSNDCPHTSAAPADSVQGLVRCDRPWGDYPVGTRAYAIHGGYWTRVENGWKWFAGDTFPRPGGEAVGRCILLPPNNVLSGSGEREKRHG